MNKFNPLRLLDYPPIYQLSQLILAPGAEKMLSKAIGGVIGQLPPARRILDVACGPKSWLWQARLKPVGMDLCHSYALTFNQQGKAVTGSAVALPFASDSFDAVWNFGLLHHLSEADSIQAINEMVRIVRSRGHVIIFDGILPNQAWRRPIPWALRKLDRGRFMRPQDKLESLLENRNTWESKRITYSFIGHEGVFLTYTKR